MNSSVVYGVDSWLLCEFFVYQFIIIKSLCFLLQPLPLATVQYILNMSSESDPEDTFSSFTQTTAPTEWGSELQAGHMDRDDDSFSVGVLYVSYNPNGQGSPRIFDLKLCARAAAG